MKMTREMENQYHRALANAGLSAPLVDPDALRRIALTLDRWAEAECNGEIEVDEETGKARRNYNTNRPAPMFQVPIPNRYAGALRRLAKLLPEGYTFEVQGDPRGWPLTIKAPNGAEVSPPPFSR